MDIDAPKSDLINPRYSINVLQLLKSAQMQHALRHMNYTHYRRYCTARLRRLYKSLKFTHGRGKYTRKAVTESTVTEVRKAVKWADLFSRLCAAKGDSRTSLEAEAYAAYMNGNLLFEQDRSWDTALKNFISARAVYEELGKYGDMENQLLCQ
ncbi:signal recognition particle-related / SRP-related [Euphorbia peplus]|nr:signal recognition particle-related / SRP-related [Euphorbia peplus]